MTEFLEFVGQSAQDAANIAGNPSRLINVYREPIIPGGVSGHALKPVMGTEVYRQFADGAVRALEYCEGGVYAAVDGGLYRVDRGKVATIRDDVRTSIAAASSAAPDSVSVGVVAGGRYFLFRDGQLTEPTGGAFSRFGGIEYIGGHMVMTERNGRQFLWADLFDPSTIDGANFATTERGSDNNIRPMRVASNLWIFKERSIEIWYQSGASFLPVPGGMIETGLRDFRLLTRVESGAFFIGDDGIAYLTLGQGLQPVSTPPVEYSIANEQPENCFYYETQGHKFCCITFAGRPAWVYDVATAEWHERATDAQHKPWEVTCTVKDRTGWIAGDKTGGLSRFTKALTDKGTPMRRTAISRNLYQMQPFRVADVEFVINAGGVNIGRQPMLWARVSADGGNTWSEQVEGCLAAQGDYSKRVIFRQMGWFERQMTLEINITDEIDTPIMSRAMVRLV